MPGIAPVDPAAAGSVISLPTGGGAIAGLGEKFAADPFTGTANFTVPISLPAGRAGLSPQLALHYNTGSGAGPYGLGWALSVPGVTRKTSTGVPRYLDRPGPDEEPADVFVLAGADDLVPVAGGDSAAGRQRYRPRTESGFARIEHVTADGQDFWEVRSADGLLTRYGSVRPAGAPAQWRDPAIIADPAGAANSTDPANPARPRIFGWRITETIDPLGNVVRYEYRRDQGDEPGHRWDQPLLSAIRYADYGDRTDPSFLVQVDVDYEPRPDAVSDRRAGFELRTSLRCRTIRVSTHAADGVTRVLREHRLSYQQAPFSGVSLLARFDVVGVDAAAGASPDQPATENLPPLTFTYAGFDPAGRRFAPLTGSGLPTVALSDPSIVLADLRGIGLPDLVELSATPRYWRNAGGGRFELPRPMPFAPPFQLGAPGVQLIDADGDGRPDLVVPSPAAGASARAAGYFPMTFGDGWSRRSFQPYRQSPTVSLTDPSVRLIDLTGDGRTDVLESRAGLRGWFNHPDPRRAWARSAPATGARPDVDLADPRVRLADMTGDGLTDIVVVRDGAVSYWPNLGHNRWGEPITMRHPPRLPDGADLRRLLLGDLDGDGAADLIYVDHGRVLIWINQSGDGWTEQPVVITGTPPVVDTDAVTIADLYGTGMGGVLFSRAADGSGRPHLWFLDLTGGVKPHLLTGLDNHFGARTTIRYRPSTQEALRDQVDPATRWRTTLPFPVQVVSTVEVVDQISGGRLTTEYRYRHGYWDGLEREFRGFATVDQLDAETFANAPTTGPGAVPDGHFSPPTLTRSWFHPGPVAAVEAGDWTELDLSHEYWDGDAPMLSRPAELTALLQSLPRLKRRGALRAMRGHQLRTEMYGLDGTSRASRPYTVTESLPGVRLETDQVHFPVPLAGRTTQWERGDDPMTQLIVPAGFDQYGLQAGEITVAVPRGRDPRVANPAADQPYLTTYVTTEYARRDDPGHYLVDRVARTTTFEVRNDGTPAATALAAGVLAGQIGPGSALPTVSLRVIGHSRTYYDGAEFTGLPLGTLGAHGLPVRAEQLAFTDGFLDDVFDPADPRAVTPRPVYLAPDGVVTWPAEYPAEFRTSTPPLAGYRHDPAGAEPGSPAGYYLVTNRHRYDVHDPNRTGRGLVLATQDPLGATTRIDYDQHDLLAVRATDAAGLSTSASHDLRLLQPASVTDINGILSSVSYSPLGMVTATFHRGPDSTGGTGDAVAPSTRLTYDTLAFADRGEPVSVRTQRRIHHDTATGVPADQRDAVLTSIEFTDGFGRIVQTRTQAEDTLFGDPTFGGQVIPGGDLAPVGSTTGRTRAPSDPDNVVVSGHQVYDNKGNPVQRFQPFYSAGFGYQPPDGTQLGVRTLIFYDPRGQAVRLVDADGSEQRMILGVPADLTDPDTFAPSPWETFTYDANDNAGRTHPATTTDVADHWNTPASIEIDALGRTVRTVARTGAAAPGTAATEFVTRSRYDLRGNLTGVTDALGRTVFSYVFDLANRRWRVDSADAGRRDTVLDAVNHPVETRDSKGVLLLGGFDLLHRPTRLWARDRGTTAVTLRQRLEYGDAGDPGQPAADRSAAAARNLLGRVVRHHDEAGLVITLAVDLHGNVIDSDRRVISDDAVLASYRDAATNAWRIVAFQVDWTPPPGQTQDEHDRTLLEPTGYRTTTTYDALSRITSHTFPTDVTGRRPVLRPAYNRAGALEQVHLDDAVFVQRIAYDAKGQRVLIAYGNGVLTRYAYHPHTLRLVRLRTEPYTTPDGLTYHPAGAVVQEYGYDYDLVGNVTRVRDRTPGSGIRNNPDALDVADPDLRKLIGLGEALDRRFRYDPVYRLLSATGREIAAPPAGDPWTDTPRGTDLSLAQPYTERYSYDAAGSMLTLTHDSAGGFTRAFMLDRASTRLLRTTIGKTGYDLTFDGNGNVTSETTSRHLTWNHADRLQTFATQVPGAEPSVHAQYLYDANGHRVKKLVRRQGGSVEVTHYLGEVFEHHRRSLPTRGENNHVLILDGQRRIAVVRTGPAHPDDRGPAVAVHLGDHLGSSAVILDQAGAITNREEFTPYGQTSFGSYTRKRYRFIGKERDEESSLVVTAARHYSPWTARWVSCEPQGGLGYPATPPTNQSLNSYGYAQANPLRLVDSDGRQPTGGVDLTQKVPPVLGSRAHDDILPVLARRLDAIGYDARADRTGLSADLKRNGILTAPGGSLSGKSRGELDLVVRMIEDHTIVGHVYELKPGRLVGAPKTGRQVDKQVRFGQRLLFPGNPLFYKAGTVLAGLNPVEAALVFAPIVVQRDGITRVYQVGLIRDAQGEIIDGQIGYSFADSSKRRQTEPQESPVADRVPLVGDRAPFPIGPREETDEADSPPAHEPLTPGQKAARDTATVVVVAMAIAAFFSALVTSF